MLTIEFVNSGRGGRGAAVGDYNVRVLVNGVVIYRDKIVGHRRADGWRTLVKRLMVPGTNARRRYTRYTPCAGCGLQAVAGKMGIGFQCPSCGLMTIPFPNGTIRRHAALPAEGS